MIEIVTGVPGSGKSYFMVYHILKNLNRIKKYKTIITNIDNIKVDLINVLYSDVFNIETTIYYRKIDVSAGWCWNKAYIENFISQFPLPILFVLDEVQREVGLGTNIEKSLQKEVVEFFSYHRHYGLDFILGTQSIKLIFPGLRDLIEYEVQAKPQSLLPVPSFVYRYILLGEVVKRTYIRKSDMIFYFYSSTNVYVPQKKFYGIYVFLIIITFVVFILIKIITSKEFLLRGVSGG